MTTKDTSTTREQELLYDWNLVGEADVPVPTEVELDDETLRDGLQSPSVRQPTLYEKLEILHRIEALGIHAADIGYPGADPVLLDHVVALAKEIDEAGHTLRTSTRSQRRSNVRV